MSEAVARCVGPRKRVVLAMALANGLALNAMASPSPSGPADLAIRNGPTAVLPDHRRLSFHCAGSGSPTVILESGFGASSLAWAKVQPLIAARWKVCSYDRAGYGASDPGPLPRDGAAVARDLDDGLRAARLGGPFIMVGHSAGGLYVRLFAARRPKDVAGLVLVDPSVPHQDALFSSAFGAGAMSLAPLRLRAEQCLRLAEQGRVSPGEPQAAKCLPPPDLPILPPVRARRIAEASRPSIWRTQIAELDSLWSLTSDEVDAIRPLRRNTPLIVLTAGGGSSPNADGAGATALRFWRGLHQQIATTSTDGAERLVHGSSHMMMNDRPDAILSAIGDVIARSEDYSHGK